jgi:hypothetical protein
VALDQLVERALGGFAPRLPADKFDVHVDIPDDLPDIRGDQTALGLVLDNLIDNAIRYSGAHKWLEISARRQDSGIAIGYCRSRRRHSADDVQSGAVLSRPSGLMVRSRPGAGGTHHPTTTTDRGTQRSSQSARRHDGRIVLPAA